MSIIILEGENKTGKTTIADLLHKKTGYKIYKSSQPGKNPFNEYMEVLDKIGNKNAIIDRFHLGEFVYGPIYRGKCGLTMEQMKKIEDRLLEKDSMLIYCYDTSANIHKRFISENEEFAKYDKVIATLFQYDNILKETRLPILKHRMKSERDITNLLKLI